MDLGISGRTAVVIGASSGLGLAAAESLAAEGCSLVLFARDAARLTSTADELKQRFDVDVATFTGDITSRSTVNEFSAFVAARGADILVLNTPRPPSPMKDFLEERDERRWEVAYRDQLQSALNVLLELSQIIIESGQGRIIGITSASVKNPMPRHAISTIYRAGVQAALKHLALEVAHTGTTVNAIAPATIITPTFAQFHDLERRIADTPLKRAGTSEELGALVAFLASSHAGYLTGQLLQLDGGRTTSLV